MRFKRFLIIDLFERTDDFINSNPKVWISDKLPDVKNGIYKVKDSYGNIVTAYFFDDKLISLRTAYEKNINGCGDNVSVTVSYWYDVEGNPISVVAWGGK